MTDKEKKNQNVEQDEIKRFINKKKSQNKALQKMMEQLESSKRKNTKQ